MIGILADTPHDAELMRQAVAGGVRVIHAANDLTAADLDIECLVFSSRSELLPERISLLREVERKLPWVPVILVTDRKISIARLLTRVQVADLVWFEDVERQLAPRIESACSGSALLQMADRIRRSTAPPALRSALAHSLREARRTPVRNVQELAAAVGLLSRDTVSAVSGPRPRPDDAQPLPRRARPPQGAAVASHRLEVERRERANRTSSRNSPPQGEEVARLQSHRA